MLLTSFLKRDNTFTVYFSQFRNFAWI